MPEGDAPANDPYSPRALSAIARSAFTDGPLLNRTLQRWRPFIMPFDRVLAFIPEDAAILDVGCGGGLLGVLAAVTRKPRCFIGFDSSPDAIAVARAMASRLASRVTTSLEFHRLDAGDPWPDGPFNVVTIIDVIHHVPPEHQRGVLLRAASVLPPGGRLIYKDMTRRGLVRPLMNRLHDLALARQWIHYADIGTVRQWLTGPDAGLALVHQSYHTRWWYGHDLLVMDKPIPADPPTASRL